MGYKPKRTLYKLNFAETEHSGLEVTTRAVTVDGLLEITGLAAAVDGITPEQADAESARRVSELIDRFARILVSWNVVDDDDQPVPATREGLGSQDFPFVMAIILAWITEMSQAPPPLPNASTSGAPTLEASIPMAPSSPSPPS